MNIRQKFVTLFGAFVTFFMMQSLAPARAADEGGIQKICPPAEDTGTEAIETLIGQGWGYAEVYAVYAIIVLTVALLIGVFVPKAKKAILDKLIPAVIILLLAGGLIAFIGSNIGSC